MTSVAYLLAIPSLRGANCSWQGSLACSGLPLFLSLIRPIAMTRKRSACRLLLFLAALGTLGQQSLPAQASAPGGQSVPCQQLVSSIKPLKVGFKWTEGPAWDPAAGRWIFSDLMDETEYAITPAGALTPLRRPAGFPNGHALLPDGSFVVAQHDRTLGKVNADGSGYQVLARSFQGRKLNSPNDVTVASNGDVFFTDPIFGIDGFGPVKAKPELPFRGVYRYSKGNLSLITDKLEEPNGIALNATGTTLYVSQTSNNTIYTIDISAYQGKPLPVTPLFTFKQIPQGHPSARASDGLRVDSKGNIWATGPGGIGVFRSDGTNICSIPFHDHVANLAPGGRDGRSLLVTSADKVYLIGLQKPF